jgi:hypothetical protein
MPPGNTRFKPPAKILERATAGTCLAIAHRIERDRRLCGDTAGAEAAHQVAESIEAELLQAFTRSGGPTSG